MGREVKVIVKCKCMKAGKTLGYQDITFIARKFQHVSSKLLRSLKKQLNGLVKCTSWQKFKIGNLRCKHTKQQKYCKPGASWSKGLRVLQLKADVRINARRVPKELQVHVRHFGDWPDSHYMLDSHKVRCGCQRCKELQLNGEAAEEEGTRYVRRQALRQHRGFWTPTNFVQHVIGVKIGGGRHPAGVPQLKSKYWLTFACEAARGSGPAVQLDVDDLKREFGYVWQPRKDFPRVD